MRRFAAATLFLALTVPARAEPGFVAIDVTATPILDFNIAPGVTQDGEVSFRGGLVLRSSYRQFGAISGLDISADGHLVAIADTGFWLTGQLVEDADGWLLGVEGWQMAPILDENGEEANAKGSADAEGLRFDPLTDTMLVSFEGNHRVSRFAAGDLGTARPVPVALPTLTGLHSNRGIEAVAIAPPDSSLAGAVVIISEEADDGAGNIRGWVVDGPRVGAFSVRREDQYAVTDAAFLPNGDLLILERLLSLGGGIGMRIRRIAGDAIRPGAVVDGPVVLSDTHLFQIDNMEGMALRPLPTGEVLITIVSDDNHSLLQRTMLLQFLWREAAQPMPVPRPSN
jgi:hypothetical protein